MEEIQFLSCDLEQVQLESSNSRQAHQDTILAEGLRQVQRDFQNQDDAKNVADLKMAQDQKINEEKEPITALQNEHPYFGTTDFRYEETRKKFTQPTKEEEIESSNNNSPLTDYWLDDQAMQAIIYKEIEEMGPEKGDLCYIFNTFVWSRLIYGLQGGHIAQPAKRYENAQISIWPGHQEEKRKQMQTKFNPFHRKYLFVPVISDRHWNLAVVMNPSKIIRRLRERNPPKEYFTKKENEDPWYVSEKEADRHDLELHERYDTRFVSQIPPVNRKTGEKFEEPVIYFLCSVGKASWYSNCEIINEMLTGMFLDEDNPSMKAWHTDLLDSKLLKRITDKKTKKSRLEIVHGRKAMKLMCRDKERRARPCRLCLKQVQRQHKRLLPFRYYEQKMPRQFTTYDCGINTLYSIRKWMQEQDNIEKWLHTDLSSWWTQEDIYNYKYECRRYLDKVVGQPGREKVNVFGTAAENCYLKGTTDSYIALSKVRKGANLDEETDSECRKEQDFETDFTETDIDYATTDLDDETDATDTEGIYQKVLVNGDPVRKFADEESYEDDLTKTPYSAPVKVPSSDKQTEAKTNTADNSESENTEKSDEQNQKEAKSSKTKSIDNDTDDEKDVDDIREEGETIDLTTDEPVILEPSEERKTIIRKENKRIERCERQYRSLVRHAANSRPYLPRRARLFPLNQKNEKRSKKLTKKRPKKSVSPEPSKKRRLPEQIARIEAAFADRPPNEENNSTACSDEKRKISSIESYFMWLGAVRGSLRKGSPGIRQNPAPESQPSDVPTDEKAKFSKKRVKKRRQSEDSSKQSKS